MNFFSIIFSLLLCFVMGLFIYKSVAAIVVKFKEKKVEKKNNSKTIEIDKQEKDKK